MRLCCRTDEAKHAENGVNMKNNPDAQLLQKAAKELKAIARKLKKIEALSEAYVKTDSKLSLAAAEISAVRDRLEDAAFEMIQEDV
jgi:hypothetical protein